MAQPSPRNDNNTKPTIPVPRSHSTFLSDAAVRGTLIRGDDLAGPSAHLGTWHSTHPPWHVATTFHRLFGRDLACPSVYAFQVQPSMLLYTARAGGRLGRNSVWRVGFRAPPRLRGGCSTPHQQIRTATRLRSSSSAWRASSKRPVPLAQPSYEPTQPTSAHDALAQRVGHRVQLSVGLFAVCSCKSVLAIGACWNRPGVLSTRGQGAGDDPAEARRAIGASQPGLRSPIPRLGADSACSNDRC